jgi:YD repeat-containing protein
MPNGVGTERTYTSFGFLNTLVSKQNGVPFDSRIYTRDNAGLLLQEAANGQTFQYTYDDLYRLQTVNIAGTAYSWSFDAVGNRLSQTVAGVTTSYTHDAANRLTAVNGVPVTHDANGCLTAFGSDSHTWDVRGRLRTLTRAGATYQFGYNHEGLRTSKTVNGTTTHYLLDGASVVSETTGGATKHTLQGPGTDNVLQRDGKWRVRLKYSFPADPSSKRLRPGAPEDRHECQYGQRDEPCHRSGHERFIPRTPANH